MTKAVAAYSGPIKRCRPGKARAADLPKKADRPQQWLNTHRKDAPLRDKKAERRKRRMARAERERIEQRNTAVRKRNSLYPSR
jgi:hypothetical protein